MFDWYQSTNLEKLGYLGIKLQAARNNLHTLQQYYDGTQPTAFLTQDEQEQLQDRVRWLSVNYCRLLTDQYRTKVAVTGFRVGDSTTPDPKMSEIWTRNQMLTGHNLMLRDVFALGKGFLSVWAKNGKATITCESPFQMTTFRDPVTREVVGALKMWHWYDKVFSQPRSYAVLYLPDQISYYTAESGQEPTSIPGYSWVLQESVPNPLGCVPVVEFLNQDSILDFEGVSEFQPIMGLQDALNKVVLDSLIASEYGSFLRRWATGITIQEDDEGNPINPFSNDRYDVWLSEHPEATFGQFEAASLQSFQVEAEMLTKQIAAITNLPDHQIATRSANPTSAEALNSATLILNQRASTKADQLTPNFSKVAALALAIENGVSVDSVNVQPVFADMELRTQSAATDSFVKLVQSGVPMDIAAELELGWTPDQAARLKGLRPPQKTNQNEGAPTQ